MMMMIVVSPSYRRSHGMTGCSHLASQHDPYGHHQSQSVRCQFHQSRMDSLLPSRVASSTFGHFLGRHVWLGTVVNRHSRLQTGGRYSVDNRHSRLQTGGRYSLP